MYDNGGDGDAVAVDGPNDTTYSTPTLRRSLFDCGIEEMLPNFRVAVIEAAATLTNLLAFPSNHC